jgi:hypothetical protein
MSRLAAIACCCFVACTVPAPEPAEDSSEHPTTRLELQAGEDGAFSSCDADGACETLPNPDNCAILIVIIDNVSGRTCERCEGADGQVIYDRCDETRVVCTVITIPEPDCVVCAYDQGSIVYSSCTVGDDPNTGECTADECGPAPMCPALLCSDGSTAGCTGVCERDPATGLCGYSYRECPPDEPACATDADCPPGWFCDGSSVCPDGVQCFWEGEPGVCKPRDGGGFEEGRCAHDSDCREGQVCVGSSLCPEDVVCVWAGEPGYCEWPTDCSIDACGPPPPCAPLECSDGNIAGCSCKLDPASNSCGWIHDTCSEPPSSELCEPVECGRSVCPSQQCDDGTWTGACDCVRTADGVCAWQPGPCGG